MVITQFYGFTLCINKNKIQLFITFFLNGKHEELT